jgi:hypothetical protein
VQRVLVVGDSVALTLGRGIERWGPAHGIGVVNAARYYCAVARGGAIEDFLGVGASAGCEEWTEHWAAELDRFDPDVVVILTTIWDVSRRRRVEWGPDWVGPGDARFDRWARAEWQAAARLLGSRGARVVWLTAPCAAEAARSERLAYGARHYAPGLARPGVDVVDLAAHVCPGGRFSDTIDGVAGSRPDGLHFSDPGADAVAAWLGPQLLAPPPADRRGAVSRAGRGDPAPPRPRAGSGAAAPPVRGGR